MNLSGLRKLILSIWLSILATALLPFAASAGGIQVLSNPKLSKVYVHCAYQCTSSNKSDVAKITAPLSLFEGLTVVSQIADADVVLFFVGPGQRSPEDEQMLELRKAQPPKRLVPVLLTKENGFSSLGEYSNILGLDFSDLHPSYFDGGPEFYSREFYLLLAAAYSVPQIGSIDAGKLVQSFGACEEAVTSLVQSRK